MNIAQLRTFVTVVDRGSFSDAARAMGISQPAVTMQIQALEADAGATLLDRRYRRIDLTEAGRTLLPYARRVLAEVESAREDIAALSGAVTGHLSIAASTTPGVYVIPRLLGGFLAANPEVHVTITVHDTAQVAEAIQSGRADLGVTGAVVKGSRATYTEIGCDELLVICAPDSPFAALKGAALTDLAEADWVMRERGSGTRQVAEQLLTERGVDPDELRVVVELGTGEAVVSAVEGGLGVAMLSRHVAEKALALDTVARVDLAGPAIVRPFYTLLPKGTPTRAAAAFAAYLAEAAPR
ncbi:MAG: LysR family transcriptional regulator [Coriobacteriia bacterium]